MGSPRTQTAWRAARLHGVAQIRRGEHTHRADRRRTARRDDCGRSARVLPQAALRGLSVCVGPARKHPSRCAHGSAPGGMAIRGLIAGGSAGRETASKILTDVMPGGTRGLGVAAAERSTALARIVSRSMSSVRSAAHARAPRRATWPCGSAVAPQQRPEQDHSSKKIAWIGRGMIRTACVGRCRSATCAR